MTRGDTGSDTGSCPHFAPFSGWKKGSEGTTEAVGLILVLFTPFLKPKATPGEGKGENATPRGPNTQGKQSAAGGTDSTALKRVTKKG